MNKINLCHEEIIIFVSLSSSASPQWPLWRMRPTSWSSPAGWCSSTLSPWTCSSQRFLQVRWNEPSTCRLCLSITSSFTFSEKWETRGYPQQTPHPRAWWGPVQRGRWRIDEKENVSGLYWFVCVSRLRLQWLQRCQGEIKGQAAEVAAPRLDLWTSRPAQHSQGIHIITDRDTPDGGAAPVLDVQSSDDWRP